MNKTHWIIGIVLVIIVIAAFLFMHAHSAKAPVTTPETNMQEATTSAPTGNAAVGATGTSAIVTYSDSGFSPKSLNVSEGTTVTWVNKSAQPMWIASGNHPTHTLYDGTSASQHCVSSAPDSSTVFDECTQVAPGGSFSFTFAKTGTWTYHNHVHANDQGTVVVTAATAAGPIHANVIPE